ncbi:hypothetical protein [Salinisphaera orenii]|uniref:Uncharacterized protein n=1 Tax=Salinisphaera orenii YIM 95161 TaxID=1051139 RepID=A0A423PRQ3_9GAMM|nr:hypothetical protein [Salinisphaera halophila]ROO28270.1 hypothetical protein SAHL_10720 [Salinisphaera halophila YIM 95161]
MSDPIERSHFWVFDDEQLEAALAEHWPNQPEAHEPQNLPDIVRGFLHSAACQRRDMRRGGD